MHVRRAVLADAAGLARLRGLLYDTSDLVESWSGETEAAFAYRLTIDENFVAFVVDLGNGQLVSSADGTRARRLPGSGPGGPDYGYIGSLATAPGRRRRGYARAAVTAAMSWPAEHGCASIRLYASPRGTRLYEQLGFQPLSTPVLQWQPQTSEGYAVQEPEGTAALITNSAGEYLLHLRDNIEGICDPGTWSLLGGNRDSDDETPEAAIARELKEEAGLVLPELKKYTVVDAHGPLGGQITVFFGHWDGDARTLPLTEGIMLGWFPASLVPRLVMSPWAKSVIERHQAQRAQAALSAGAVTIGSDTGKALPESDFYCAEVLSGRTPVTVVAETDAVLAFEHTRPSYPVHIVVVPKQHTPSLVDLGHGGEVLLLKVLTVVRYVAARVQEEHGAARVVTNLGGYQESKHLHVHVTYGQLLESA
ncbi:GNAT family N-acetyltransferase [Streptomyces sp. URMC 127]|uniref:GNAT family N-acetyltransferase n=1 Tax=Streptomyces sp. URMC 127 TaxID=3423402 RepID=UPI003F1B0F41